MSRTEVPKGWSGRYRDTRSPNGWRVFFSSNAWTIQRPDGTRASRHDSRESAIRVAKKLGAR